ncbi:MAG TPA: PD-(D/E)XK nuclease family protein [Candidatus Dormibacteraeota bacterium]|nr:PD-(D/E)XK nuclease family protein [Candidatus Dormibacteraeota bacterium]
MESHRSHSRRPPAHLPERPSPGILSGAPPDPAEPFAASRPYFSASQLNTYANCPRQYLFRYLCDAVEDEGTYFTLYGTLVHRALERFHQEYGRPHEGDPGVMELRLVTLIDDVFRASAAEFTWPVQAELGRRKARRVARRYVRWLVERARREPFEVVSNEERQLLDLDGFAFVGYIDRLDRSLVTGEVTIVDYKTGSVPESAHAYRAKVRAGQDFQLPFYYWARRAAGDRVASLALIQLKDPRLPVEPLEVRVAAESPRRVDHRAKAGVVTERELEESRRLMVDLCARISVTGIARYEIGGDPPCDYCVYAGACRERPAPAAGEFAR